LLHLVRFISLLYYTLDCVYSLWYNAPTTLPAGSLNAEQLRFQVTGWHCNGCIISQAVNTV